MPKNVEQYLRARFPAPDADLIVANWSLYSELRFSRATNRQILAEARMVLTLAREDAGCPS